MKAPPFAYVRASTVPEACALLSDPEAKPIAGGQSLLASLAFRLSQPTLLVDIGGIADLSGISLAGDRLRLGALTTHTTLGRNALVREHAPLLTEAAKLIAHPAIRNRGTIGGSLAYADPAAELPAVVVALDATIIATSSKGERRIAAVDFFTGLLSTALVDGELITAVEVPCRAAADTTAIDEIARRSGDYAMAGAAVKVTIDGARVRGARLVMFGVGTGPVLAATAAAALVGQPLGTQAIAAAQAGLDRDIDPPADQHGGPDTKRHLARVVLGRALNSIASGAT